MTASQSPALILASSSESRKALLNKLSIPFTSHNPDINEQALANEQPEALSQRLAKEKALHSAKELGKPGLYIGSDQVACLHNSNQTALHSSILSSNTGFIQLHKPLTQEAAIEQLSLCQGKSATFYTSLCLFNSVTQQHQIGISPYTVTFRQLNKQQIERYVSIDEPLHCAGSFKMEALGISLFSSMQGEDPNSLVGLPLIMLCDFLLNEGVYPI